MVGMRDIVSGAIADWELIDGEQSIIGHYRTLQTMVIVGRIALPLGAWTKAVGAGGTIGTDRAMHHDLVASGFRDFQSARERLASLCSGSEIRQIDADFLGAVQRWAQGIARRPIRCREGRSGHSNGGGA